METKAKNTLDEGKLYLPSRSRIFLYALRIFLSVLALGLYVAVFRTFSPPVALYIALGIFLVPLTAYMVWHDVVALQSRVILYRDYLEYHNGSSSILVPYNDLHRFVHKQIFDTSEITHTSSQFSSDSDDRYYRRGCWYMPWDIGSIFGGDSRDNHSDDDFSKGLGVVILLISAFLLALGVLVYLWNTRPGNWGVLLRHPATPKGGGWLDRLLRGTAVEFIPIGAVVEFPEENNMLPLDVFQETQFGAELAIHAPHLFSSYTQQSGIYSTKHFNLIVRPNGLEYSQGHSILIASWKSMQRLENRINGSKTTYGIVLDSPPRLLSGDSQKESDPLFINLSSFDLAPTLEDLRDTSFGMDLYRFAPQLFPDNRTSG
jgi:hypothetical protein